MEKPKILFLYTDWSQNPERMELDKQNLGYGGVGYYRLVKPAKFLSEWYDIDCLGGKIKDFGENNVEVIEYIFQNYDMVVTKPIDDSPTMGALMFGAEHFKKPLVIDIDDNYFEIKPDQPGYKWYHPGSTKRAVFGSQISLATALFVSTQPLADYYKKHIKQRHGVDQNVFVLPNCTDTEDWNIPNSKRDNEKIIIGYAGSTTHNKDLEIILPVLGKVLEEEPNVYLEFLGAISRDKVKELFNGIAPSALDKISIKGGTNAWKGYPELLKSQPWDIGVCPLVNDDFCKGKSHIKWMEYAMCGIPALVSNVYPYVEPVQGTPVVEHGKTGLVFNNSEDFEQHLYSLIKDGKIRTEIAENAKKAVVENWQYKNHIHKWRRAIDSVCSSMIPPPCQELSKPAKTTQT